MMSSSQPGPSGLQNVPGNDEINDFVARSNQRKNQTILIEDSGSDMEYNDSISIKYDQTDSDSGGTTFGESDNESDLHVESDELSEVFENVKNLGEWTHNGSFKQFSFEGITGLQTLPEGPHPQSFFELLFDKSFFSMIVAETNNSAEINKGDQWKKLTVVEFRTFFGLFLHMGTIKCSKIQNYWNIHRLFGFNCFSRHMSRNRFEDILCSLCFSSNNGNNNCVNKVLPIVEYVNKKMKDVYYPHKELSIAKTELPWKSRLATRQTIVSKSQKRSIRLYVLTESSGIALRIKVSGGSNNDINEKPHKTQMAIHLLEDFLQKGHSVFMDNYYTSFMLSKQLLDSKTYCTGILQKFREGNNEDIVKTKLSKGEVISCYKDNIMMGKFKDRRDILFISSEYKIDLVETGNQRNEKLKKPLVLHKYLEFMNGVNKKDQILSYFTSSRGIFKWYIKLWIYVVETLLLNSFFLYSKYSFSTPKLNFCDFRLTIIDILLYENYQENIPPTLPEFEHLPEMLSRRGNNKIKRKRCRQCTANGLRKETNYFCKGCQDNPGLCLGTCFRDYHKRVSIYY